MINEVEEMREKLAALEADQQLLWCENQKLRVLLVSLVDPEDCQFDHHGGCQEHRFLDLEPGEICPNQAAKDILATPAAENGANQ